MAENNSSSNSNSWTILAPVVKESAVESVGALSEGQAELQTEDLQADPTPSEKSELKEPPAGQPNTAEPHQVPPLESNETSPGTHIKEDTVASRPFHVDNLPALLSNLEEQEATGDTHASKSLLESDQFSDSYTHLDPSDKSTSVPAASQEQEGFSQDEEKYVPKKILTEELKPDVEENKDKGDGLRKRNISLISSLDCQDEEEEEEEEEEQFRSPQREGDIGFTLNKCIFGALILLGVGTIFFSGVLVDLDDEGDTDVKDQKYSEMKKEWLNLDIQGDTENLDKPEMEGQKIESLQAHLQQKEELKTAPQQAEDGTTERLWREQLELENQKIRGELDKLPGLQKDLEQEHERVKSESEKVKKELEALPVLQKELELLKDKVTQLTASAQSPSAGNEAEVSGPVHKDIKDKKRKAKDLNEFKEWKKDAVTIDDKEGEKRIERGQKKWQKEKIEQEKGKNWRGKEDRKKEPKGEEGERWKHSKENQELKDGKGKEEWKESERWKHSKESQEIQDGKGKRKWKGGETWRSNKENQDMEEEKGKGEWKKDKKWTLEKHGEFSDDERGKKWKDSREKGKEDKQWRQKTEQNDHKHEREGRHGQKADLKARDWKEKNDWKEREDWDSEGPRKASSEEKHSGGSHKEKTRKQEKERPERKDKEKKHWHGKHEDHQKDGEPPHEWKEEGKHKDKLYKREEKWSKKGKEKSSRDIMADRRHRKDHVDYWTEQREKIRHFHGSIESCTDVTACAHAEGLTPVSQQDFNSFISIYLSKLGGSEDLVAKKEKLNKLTSEFFTNGMFTHDQIPFGEFVEDIADVLEDLAETEDEKIEDEMNGFARKAMEKFGLEGTDRNKEKTKSGKKRRSG